MPAIHVVERLDNLVCVEKDANEWESGYWKVTEDTARRLVGGAIYLHGGQKEPSRFGGEILGYCVQPDGEYAGRIVFRFRSDIRFKSVRAGRGGWGNEKKIVW